MTPETSTLDDHELEALLDQINTRTPTGARNYALLQLMAQTGVRCGEALQAEPADIRQEEWASNGERVKVWVLRLPRKPLRWGRSEGARDRSVATDGSDRHLRSY